MVQGAIGVHREVISTEHTDRETDGRTDIDIFTYRDGRIGEVISRGGLTPKNNK